MSTKILIVDDNRDLVQITQIILKSEGYETFSAITIDDARRKIRIHQPQLILLDCSICEQNDGQAYCRQLKDEAATSGIRVIMMSGTIVTLWNWEVPTIFCRSLLILMSLRRNVPCIWPHFSKPLRFSSAS